MKYYVRGGTPPPVMINLTKGSACVNHTCACKHNGSISGRAPEKGGGVGWKERSCGVDGGQTAWTHVWDAACAPLPRAVLSSPAKSSPSTETWPVMLNGSSRNGAHPIPAGAMDQALMQGHNPGSALSAGFRLSPACKEPEGQSPSVCPSNKGGNEDGEGHCSKRPWV